MYNYTIELIKQREGLILHPYKCPAGKLTIGYGHRIQCFQFSSISPLTADSIIRVDIDNTIKILDLDTSISTLPLHRKVVLSSLILNIGVTAFYRSTLRKLIIANKPIEEEWLKWCHYRKDSNVIKSSNMLNSRKKELELWNMLQLEL